MAAKSGGGVAGQVVAKQPGDQPTPNAIPPALPSPADLSIGGIYQGQYRRAGAGLRYPRPQPQRFKIRTAGLDLPHVQPPTPTALALEEDIRALQGTVALLGAGAAYFNNQPKPLPTDANARLQELYRRVGAQWAAAGPRSNGTLPTDYEFEGEAATRFRESVSDVADAVRDLVGTKTFNTTVEKSLLAGRGAAARVPSTFLIDELLVGTAGAGEEAAIARQQAAELVGEQTQALVNVARRFVFADGGVALGLLIRDP